MPSNYFIEVAVAPNTSTTERGRILERFARSFLETQNYSVQEEVRLTASEVDLLGTDRTTSERIFVECKAYRSTISAEVLQKLLGNVYFKGYSSGWLLSTFALGKDAKGFEDEWSQKPLDERRRLRIYPPEKLVDRLIQAQIIVDPKTLRFDNSRHQISADAFLLLTSNGQFWALPVTDPATGIRSASLLFNAKSGAAISDSTTLDWISKTDTTLSAPWISDSPESQNIAAIRLRAELESIVRVPMADHWADYRPARPEDFVGREQIQSAVFQFFDSVRLKTTTTRLIALKGPSGWGKSSSVLKIASRAANIRNRSKYFVFTVDSRAATTSRFPELAVLTAIKEATQKGFITPGSTPTAGPSSIFSADSMKLLNSSLEAEGKVICVFFDQFEELLYKSDLSEVFNEMRRLCSAIEEAQANFVIGFSWKTDGFIPTEHNAYHMWHSLAEHRTEIEISPFSEREVAIAINRFAKELGEPITPPLRRLLQDHCQGFPWLLKKLCIHILDLSRSGIEQVDILNQSVNIHGLFKKDLNNLSSSELGCIKQIAIESPAEFFKITQNFGDEIVSRLIEKRLVIRSGARLTIYWDIFRDYILTEKIPFIPVTYVPQANFSRYANALAFMVGKSELTYSELGKHMNLKMGATDNLVRDLASMGHVEANRKEARISPLFSDEEHAISLTFSFWKSHEVTRKLHQTYANGDHFSESEFSEIYHQSSKRNELGEKTHHSYMVRVLGWLRGLGLVAQIGKTLIFQDIPRSTVQSLKDVGASRLTQSDFFLGEAPPTKVVRAFQAINEQSLTRHSLEANYGRNSCYVLIKLGLMRSDGIPLLRAAPGQAEMIIADRARGTPTVQAADELLRADGNLPGIELGRHLAVKFGAQWSEGSLRRYGSALKQWAEWSQIFAISSVAPIQSGRQVQQAQLFSAPVTAALPKD